MDKAGMQRLALIGPLERFFHRAVEIIGKRQNLTVEINNRSEVASFEKLLYQNTEPNFEPVHAGNMFRLDHSRVYTDISHQYKDSME